jgi:N-methylhydantoinase B/oxoprolinase/acetone carboxylase alpha subunit
VRRKGARRAEPLAGGGVVELAAGDVLEIRTPGGGGHGRPRRRAR